MSADNPFEPSNSTEPPIAPMQPQVETGSRSSASPLDAIIPTNPLAAISCYAGIFSNLICITGIILGPLAIFCGYKALKNNSKFESAYGSTTSKIRAWIGIVTGITGTLLGIAVIGAIAYRSLSR